VGLRLQAADVGQFALVVDIAADTVDPAPPADGQEPGARIVRDA
jgi:hypothetical protein